MAYPAIETERLILKPLTIEDAPQIQLLFPHWEVIQYLSHRVPWPYPEDGAFEFLTKSALPQILAGHLLAWTLRLKTDPDRMMGQISLRPHGSKHRGFWLGKPYQGHGYMTEATNAVTDYWFETLGHEVLRTTKSINNTSSRRISERTGMQRVGYTMSRFANGNEEKTEIWELTREAWEQQKNT
ncbi:hypothetical protein LMG33818_001931 [Halomonadaceae bacterium LMG 33818]|uniref:GNAT family N-acetyltransferase n=1 Tax=Cernens ardua TaxID=3402176 RepID=UPI003EDB887B